MDIKTKSAGETQEAGYKFGKNLKDGDVILLFGELGSGKTTFVKGIASFLGIEDVITSPTFVFCKKYKLENGSYLCHYDCYRVSSELDAESVGLSEDLLSDKDIVVVEWPENISDILPEGAIKVYFEYISENERKIKI